MTKVTDINRDALTTAGKQVYDEYNSIAADKQWLSDHRTDANFKPRIQVRSATPCLLADAAIISFGVR